MSILHNPHPMQGKAMWIQYKVAWAQRKAMLMAVPAATILPVAAISMPISAKVLSGPPYHATFENKERRYPLSGLLILKNQLYELTEKSPGRL
jgi:hypothetical protein